MGNIKKFILPVCCIICGIIQLVLGFMNLQNTRVYLPATATITNIEENYVGVDADNVDKYDYAVFVSYEIDGKKYDSTLDTYNSTMKIGDQVNIIYNPENPTQIQTAGAITYIISLVAGVLFLVIGIVLMIRIFKGKQ